MTSEAVSERAQQLLYRLVEKYIHEGQPVSSGSLARDSAIALSPASIRNVLADLEERGYLRSLHTSSGRVPTALGYRLFIDGLLTAKPLDKTLDESIYAEFRDQLTPNQSTQNLITNASHLLARLTQMAGLVTLPRVESHKLRHVEFLPLTNQRVLVILVFNEKEVQNRILQANRDFSQSELEQAANYLNQHFSGMDIQTIRQRLVEGMAHDKSELNHLMQMILELASGVLAQDKTQLAEDDYILAGEHHLLDIADESNFARMRQLFDAFSKKREILYLLDNCLAADGVKIFIGDESEYQLFSDCSLVSAPYYAKDKIVGVLGVIGPTRMAYDKVIPIVDISARLLSSALGSDFSPE